MHHLSKKERLEKLAILKRQEEEKQKKIESADGILDQAKKFATQKKFVEAAEKYQEAAVQFRELQWNDQADLLEKEAANMKQKIQEYQDIAERLETQRQQEFQQFEQRAAQIIAKKKENRREYKEAKQKLTPAMLRKKEEAEFLLEKAEKQEKLEKWNQALKRYQYIIELYQELQYSPSNLKKIE
ncbi:MAG: hypothetical protein ACTSUK_05200 [Promethearchaeota archaeon]